MTHFAVHWGNRLEGLAARLFDSLYGSHWPDPLVPRCVVTNSPVMQAWLRHYFVYDWPGRAGRVLANCDFQLLYPFVNDWMDRLLGPAGKDGSAGRRREARRHPYAIGCLQWRIYRLLEEGLADEDGFAGMKAYLGDRPSPRRRFQLAGRLATLCDDYQVYRCNVLEKWEQGREEACDYWQAELWRRLVRENPESYAALFRGMRKADAARLRERFNGACRQVSVFGTTSMPPPYAGFLQTIMAQLVDVDLYLLNPSRADWLDDVTVRGAARQREFLLEDHPLKDDPLLQPEQGHPLLCSLGRNLQEHLHLIEALSEGVSDTPFESRAGDTVLHDLQVRILNRVTEDVTKRAPDDSIQIHICHNPRREVEVLHDHLLKWLTEEQLQPRQIQVLVPDMDTYAPLIDAVLGAHAPHAPDAIPYAIEGRPSGPDHVVAHAFRTLLNLVTSRFTATSILDLLRGEAVLAAFGITGNELEMIEEMIAAGGIRWGLDGAHRKQVTGVDMEPQTTWEYGLDRLLAGYALGSPQSAKDPFPVDCLEGDSAVAAGKLARFVDALRLFREKLCGERTLGEWHPMLAGLLDTFLVATNTTCREIGRIRSAVEDLRWLARTAGWGERPVSFDVVVSHLEGQLGTSRPGESLMSNAVVCCRLRPMHSRPAEVVCILGLNDGDFPRHDNRPTFDLLARTRHRGDRSMRYDDRQAFMETLVNARRRLYLSTVGRMDSDNTPRPPSIVLQELRAYLARTCQWKARHKDGAQLLPCEIPHRLQPVHHDYFLGRDGLFSYSTPHLLAARQLVSRKTSPAHPGGGGGTGVSALPPRLELDTLLAFFENPARYYYRRILGVDLRRARQAVTRDDEPLVPDALDRYRLSGELLALLREKDYVSRDLPIEAFSGRMKAEGILPLGSAGRETVDHILYTLTAWLDSVPAALPGTPATLRDLLRRTGQRESPPVPGCVTLPVTEYGSIALHGCSAWIEHDGYPLLVLARHGDINARDRVRAWIRHLFACATAPEAVHTLVVGKAGSAERYEPLKAEDAGQALCKLADLFVPGTATPLPFAPESSYAFCAALKDREDDPQTLREALQAAALKWGHRDDAHNWNSESKDAWLFHAFGEEGPMAPPRAELFRENSLAFFAGLLHAMMQGEDKPGEGTA